MTVSRKNFAYFNTIILPAEIGKQQCFGKNVLRTLAFGNKFAWRVISRIIFSLYCAWWLNAYCTRACFVVTKILHLPPSWITSGSAPPHSMQPSDISSKWSFTSHFQATILHVGEVSLPDYYLSFCAQRLLPTSSPQTNKFTFLSE